MELITRFDENCSKVRHYLEQEARTADILRLGCVFSTQLSTRLNHMLHSNAISTIVPVLEQEDQQMIERLRDGERVVWDAPRLPQSESLR